MTAMQLKTAAYGVLSILLLIVFFQNTGVVSFRFLFWTVSMSMIIFLPLLVLLGGLIGFFIGRKSVDW